MTKNPLPYAEPSVPDNLPEHTLSVVVPMYNEAENVEPLLERIHLALSTYPWPWEVVLVDDGSSDATPAELTRCAKQYGAHVRVVALVRNFKQTAAMQAGLDAARDAAKQGMDAMKSGWGDMSGMPDDAKKQANDACKQAVDAMKQGAQAMGCEI